MLAGPEILCYIPSPGPVVMLAGPEILCFIPSPGSWTRDTVLHTFSWSSSDVSLHLRPVGEGLGPDPEVIGHPVSQVLNLHPQGGAALHVHCDYLTNTWSGVERRRRGVSIEIQAGDTGDTGG